jgi:hypothetical protein
MEDNEIIIRFMGGVIEKHSLAAKSTQTIYYDWNFPDNVYPRISTWSVKRKMKFDKDWNLLMPVISKIFKIWYNNALSSLDENFMLYQLETAILKFKISTVYELVLKMIKYYENKI